MSGFGDHERHRGSARLFEHRARAPHRRGLAATAGGAAAVSPRPGIPIEGRYGRPGVLTATSATPARRRGGNRMGRGGRRHAVGPASPAPTAPQRSLPDPTRPALTRALPAATVLTAPVAPDAATGIRAGPIAGTLPAAPLSDGLAARHELGSSPCSWVPSPIRRASRASPAATSSSSTRRTAATGSATTTAAHRPTAPTAPGSVGARQVRGRICVNGVHWASTAAVLAS